MARLLPIPKAWPGRLHGKFRLFLAVCSGSFFAAYASSVLALDQEASRLPIAFSNLGEAVELKPQGLGHILQRQAGQQNVKLANRLLVRAGSTIGAQDLRNLSANLEGAQKLAALQTSNLWVLTFSGADMRGTMDRVREGQGVLYVQPDLSQPRQAAQMMAPSRPPAEIPHAGAMPETGRARVAIIDDGFQLEHPALAKTRLIFQYDADQRTEDAHPKTALDQHGTLVAGLVLSATGLAPGAEFIAIRQVSSWTSDMVLAFSVARMLKADIVNSSWAVPFLPEPLFDLLADWLDEAQPYLVFAAGNNRQDACAANAFSQLKGAWLVGAWQPYSNHGPCVTLQAPSRFMSTASAGGYQQFTGTSAAAAYVSGLLARELGQGHRPDAQAMQQMMNHPKAANAKGS